ncbi:MAG: PDZ domain-containing protein [Chitinophagaceae bacterium]|nr:PDZ domain-containing protein [Chitinophagaceae bacterium]
MTKRIFQTLVIFLSSTILVYAQKTEEQNDKKKDKESSVTKKEKEEKYVLVIDGDQITVNGIPVEKYALDNVEIVRGKRFKGQENGKHFFENFRELNELFIDKMKPNKAILGVSSKFEKEGAIVVNVSKESAAEKAGLQIEDIITQIDKEIVSDTNSLYKIIGKYKPNDKVTITYIRNGKTQTTTAILDKYKGPNVVSLNNIYEGFDMKNNGGNFSPRRPKIGLEIQDVEEGNGVKVLDVEDESPAEKAGLKEEDIITEINGKELKSVDDFKVNLKDLKEGDTFKLKYKRSNKTIQTEIKLPKRLKKASL